MPAAHPSRLDPTPVARILASSRTAVVHVDALRCSVSGASLVSFPPPEENLFSGGAEHRILGRPGASNRASGAGKMGPIDIPTEFQRCPWTQSSPCRVSAMPAPLSRFQVPPRARISADSSFRGISAQLACIDMCNLAPFPYKRSFRNKRLQQVGAALGLEAAPPNRSGSEIQAAPQHISGSRVAAAPANRRGSGGESGSSK